MRWSEMGELTPPSFLVHNDPNEGDFFENFVWPTLISTARAEMWPR
jgi:hypothetical protein